MMYNLIERLSRYTEKCVSDKLDPDFALAIRQARMLLRALNDDVEYLRRQHTQTYEKLKACKKALCGKCGCDRVDCCGECEWRAI